MVHFMTVQVSLLCHCCVSLFRLCISGGEQGKLVSGKHLFQVILVCFVLSDFGFLFRFRLDELRHRLIPLYSYDPAEVQDWGDAGSEDEQAELAVSKPLKLC